MNTFAPTRSTPLVISQSVETQVYGLFALAVGLTGVGVWTGMQFLPQLIAMQFVLLIIELGIVFTAGWWSRQAPLNYLMFGLFPLISGITVAPFLLYVTTEFTNGYSILLNALAATACMAVAAAVFARTTRWNLGVMGRALFFAVLGLIIMGLLQVFIPGLRSTHTELLLSGAGVVIFSLFMAYDIQRIQNLSRVGANPFMMALSLYLDIYNLFLYVLRFMMALSGNRRN